MIVTAQAQWYGSFFEGTGTLSTTTTQTVQSAPYTFASRFEGAPCPVSPRKSSGRSRRARAWDARSRGRCAYPSLWRPASSPRTRHMGGTCEIG
jgi:hypothetical protein